MSFSEHIPEKVLQYPNVLAFVNVLDALQNVKSEIISDSFRVDNPAVLMDEKWLRRKLEEFGVTDIPFGYPIQIIRQYLLNVDTICRTRGSQIGIELYCSILSFGEVTVDDTDFYRDSDVLLLDSLKQGFITEDNSNRYFYLCEDNDILNEELSLGITIKSRYFNGDYPDEAALIKAYIENSISRQLGFSPNKTITFDWQPRSEFYFHKLLNPYFV